MKGLPLPKVYVGPLNPEYAGAYYFLTNEIIISENPYFPEEMYIRATLAHEIRHAQQRYFSLFKIPLHGSKWEPGLGYENAIAKYFRTQDYELDALLYEYKYSKTDVNEWWLKELVL